jgi:hypothetical protein
MLKNILSVKKKTPNTCTIKKKSVSLRLIYPNVGRINTYFIVSNFKFFL